MHIVVVYASPKIEIQKQHERTEGNSAKRSRLLFLFLFRRAFGFSAAEQIKEINILLQNTQKSYKLI